MGNLNSLSISVIINIGLILYLFYLALKSRKISRYLDRAIQGNLFEKCQSAPLFFASISNKINLLIYTLNREKELIENILQENKLLLYQYTEFFLTIHMVYSRKEIIQFSLTNLYKLFRAEVISILEPAPQGIHLTLYQSVNKQFPPIYDKDLDKKINFNNYANSQFSNILLPDETMFVASDNLVTPYNVMSIPIIQNQKVRAIIQVINKRNRQDFSRTDEEIGTTMAMAMANQLHVLDMIEKEQSVIQKLSTIIDNIHDGIMILSDSKKIVLENPAARDFFSLNPIKKDLILAEVFAGRKTNGIDLVLFKPERLVLRGQISELETINESEKLYIVTLRNITEAKRREREKSEIFFLSATSLYKPIDYLLKSLPRLTPSKNKDDSKFDQQLIKHSESASNLINKLIYFIEIESGPLRLQKKPTLITQLVQHSLDKMESQLALAETVIERDIVESQERLFIDAGRIEQALLILFEYLLKLSSNHKKYRHIHLTTQINKNDEFMLKISHPNYFYNTVELYELTKMQMQIEKFMQSDMSLLDLNLELAFIQHIARSHGGKFSISIEKSGSKYSFTIPI